MKLYNTLTRTKDFLPDLFQTPDMKQYMQLFILKPPPTTTSYQEVTELLFIREPTTNILTLLLNQTELTKC